MVARFHSRFLSASIEMMLLALHIVAIGILVGVTSYIAYHLGKKDVLNSEEKEDKNN